MSNEVKDMILQDAIEQCIRLEKENAMLRNDLRKLAVILAMTFAVLMFTFYRLMT